jgi:hypothetical protein
VGAKLMGARGLCTKIGHQQRAKDSVAVPVPAAVSLNLHHNVGQYAPHEFACICVGARACVRARAHA